MPGLPPPAADLGAVGAAGAAAVVVASAGPGRGPAAPAVLAVPGAAPAAGPAADAGPHLLPPWPFACLPPPGFSFLQLPLARSSCQSSSRSRQAPRCTRGRFPRTAGPAFWQGGSRWRPSGYMGTWVGRPKRSTLYSPRRCWFSSSRLVLDSCRWPEGHYISQKCSGSCLLRGLPSKSTTRRLVYARML